MAGVVKVGPWGGSGGNPKDVGGDASQITRIIVRAGDVVDGMRIYFILDGALADFFIGSSTGGTASSISLVDGEYLNSLSGYTGYFGGLNVVTQLSFTTSKGATYGPYGKGGGTPFNLPIDKGGIANFYGGGGSYVDRVGVYLKPK